MASWSNEHWANALTLAILAQAFAAFVILAKRRTIPGEWTLLGYGLTLMFGTLAALYGIAYLNTFGWTYLGPTARLVVRTALVAVVLTTVILAYRRKDPATPWYRDWRFIAWMAAVVATPIATVAATAALKHYQGDIRAAIEAGIEHLRIPNF